MHIVTNRLRALRLPIASVLAIILLAAQAPVVQACSLDGIASISMNGVTASLTAGAPTAGNAAHWAPFTLLAAAPGETLRLTEDINKVRNSLPAEMLKTPFRWSFDDGGTTQGFSVTHRFSRLGWHKITVRYFWPRQQRWITFDGAQLQIVPSSELLKTNFLYYAGNVLLFFMRAIVWVIAGIVILAAVAARVQRRRPAD